MKCIVLPLLLISNFCFSQVDLNLGLRAYYPFSGNANDISGNGNNPVFNNAVITADRFGNPNSAYHFNGTNSYMQVPNSPTLNMPNKMSVSLWVKPTGYNTAQCYGNMLVTKSASTTFPSNYYVRFADVYTGCTAPTTTQERFTGNNAIAATPLVQLNEWYSVVWTSDGITEKIYVNCVLKESVPAGGVPFSNTFDMFFGHQNSASFPYWLNGDLDEIRIYDRALNQDEVNTLGGCITATPCNNWLFTPNNPSYLTAGDLDVPGNQITIEATYNRTVPLNSGLYPGHLVSKHTDVSNVNYSLFPNGCAITTTNGYKSTFENCALSLNKTYHVAMVYDGSFLKFYRNGFLHSQVACTGNMIQNNLLTTIAQYTGGGFDQQFMGYVNEVRIWNIARTQAQIQTYMNSSLPNPTTIPGLLGYYTFDNLLNKQGNAAYNATLNGAATINATNTSCIFVADSCIVPTSCNNWLSTPAQPAFVTVGDLDIPGNKLTIEATANRTSFLSNGTFTDGDLVSKHSGPGNANYILRPARALISTTNGFFFTPDVCAIQLNKTYHYAMVYDGTTLKFYRNGFLMSQVAATGNLIQNDLNTVIAWLSGQNLDENFVGYINEVRIWNVARTQGEIQTFMNNPLPNPTTQMGLLAYYTFDNLLNKQGNAIWNATLGGGATINNTNPNCTFTPEQGINVNAGNDTSFCSNGSVSHVLQGSGNGTYSWSPAIYLNNPNIQNPTATISATTTFYLTVTGSPSICSGTDSVTIYVNPLPVINTIADTTICKLSPLVLTTNSNAVTYQWTPAMYVSNPNISNPNFTGTSSQRLYVTGSTGTGCSAIDSVDVFVNPLPVVQTINDTTLCMAQSITLTTTGAQTYSWSPAAGLSNPGIPNPVFSGAAQQTYTVTGTDASGCKNTDAVTIFFSSPDSLKALPSFTICGQQAIQLDGNNGTRVSYLWSPATYLSSSTIINPWANPPLTTLYTLMVTDNYCGFDSTFTTLLTVLPAPVVTAGKSNDIDCASRSATLSASGGNQYTWSPSAGLSSATIPNPVASPASTQKYIVQVTNASGCSNTDSVTVFVNNTASLARYMPNAFTPNGDGKNDCYGLKNWMYVQQLQFYIFNRYGEQVFGTANPNKCWDGIYKGKPALAGTYVFVIKAKTDCGMEEQKGSFILIR